MSTRIIMQRSRNNPVNGDYSYYAVYGTIYRVNNQTGKNTKIKALKDAFELFDLTYYKGYLYFTEDLYYGTEMEKNQICRMQADGRKTLLSFRYPSVRYVLL